MTEEKQTPHLPEGFLLGAASSAHQVEGNNSNSDWWFYEQQGRLPRSGSATDHYHKFKEDFELARSIGLNAMRISIEWARIEPKPGQWDNNAIEHYRQVLLAMKEAGLHPMVTLHHFTLPKWASDIGGFASSKVVNAFANYARHVVSELNAQNNLWITINEPGVFTYMGYLQGKWPPFQKSPLLALRVYMNLARAHRLAYGAIKSVQPHSQISIATNNVYNEPFRDNIFDHLVVKFNDWFSNHWFLNRIKHHLDFIGLNYYFYHSLHLSWRGVERKNSTGPKSDMGWRTYPEGLYFMLMDLHRKYLLPIYITENGIANARDDMRQDYIRQHLMWAEKAIQSGAEVRGYFYWSLTDTYEWQDGFDPKFGLVEINVQTQARRIRDSAEIFKQL